MHNNHNFRSLFLDTNAIVDGHFGFSNGWHSKYHFNFARVLQKPSVGVKIAQILYNAYESHKVSTVITPNSTDGVILAHIVAAKFNAKVIRASRSEGVVSLPDHLLLRRKDIVLLVDDSVNTGNSMRQLLQRVMESNATCCGISVCLNRLPQSIQKFDVQINAMFNISLEYPLNKSGRDTCDQCRIYEELNRRLACEKRDLLKSKFLNTKMSLELYSAYSDFHNRSRLTI